MRANSKMTGTISTGWLCRRKRIGRRIKIKHFVFHSFFVDFFYVKEVPPQRRLGGPGKIGFAIGFCLWFLSPILLQPPLPILLLYSDPSSHQSSRNRRSQLKWSIFSVSCYYSPNPIDVQCCESAPISCLKICLLNILWRLWLWSRLSCHSHRKPSAYLGKWKHQTTYPANGTYSQFLLQQQNSNL